MDIKDRLFVATTASDAAEMAAVYGVGLELDQFCWAYNLDVNREALLKEVRKMMRITDRCILHAPYSEIHPAAFDKKMQALGMERLDQAFSIARSLGIHRMVVHSGYIPCLYYSQWYLSEGVDFWKRFMSDKPDDFSIMIENQMESEKDFLPEVCLRISDPRVSLCLDIGHMMVSGNGEVREWIDAFAPLCTHVHLHHNDRTFDQHFTLDIPGKTDMNRVVREILDSIPQATITLEHMESRGSFTWLKDKGYLSEEDFERGKPYQNMNSLANLVDE